ncbi:hypothetical protein MRX96_032832 [Rhipicephalus microplus]
MEIQGAVALVTRGTGFFGREVAKHLLEQETKPISKKLMSVLPRDGTNFDACLLALAVTSSSPKNTIFGVIKLIEECINGAPLIAFRSGTFEYHKLEM